MATRGEGGKRGRYYKLRVKVPGYDARLVEIFFPLESPRVPRVLVDGPTDSPHRYHASDGALCMYYPGDPSSLRWVFQDGLLRLIGHTIAHLFREAYWREHREWLGPEAPHDPSKDAVERPASVEHLRKAAQVQDGGQERAA
jgi:hypothetical protein